MWSTYLQPAALWDYGQGPIAFVPAVLLLLSIRLLGEAGWGARQVLSLCLGMTASVLVTAPFVYGMSRRAAVALGLGDPGSARHFLTGVLLAAGACVLGIASAGAYVVSVMGLLQSGEVATLVLGFVGLSSIWLFAACLSLLRRSYWLSIALIVGLAVGLATNRALTGLLDWHVLAGSVSATTVSVVVLAIALGATFQQQVLRGRRVVLPRSIYLLHEALPYFGYGLLYALLLFVPHALGWLSVVRTQPERMWALASLEAGLTLALPPIVLVSGVHEYVLRQFWLRAAAAQPSTSIDAVGRFRSELWTFYVRHLVGYLVVLGLVTAAIAAAVQVSSDTRLLGQSLGFEDVRVVLGVFQVSLIANWLLGWGVYNCMYCLTLGRAALPLRAIAVSLVVALAVGIPATVLGGFFWAIAAGVAGSVAYVVASSHAAAVVFDDLDYYYATAF
jgi:hypothetical protein